MGKKDLLKGLTEEQILKAKNCKNEAELLKLGQEEGLELTDEQLEAVSGGCGGSNDDNDKKDNDENKKPSIVNPY